MSLPKDLTAKLHESFLRYHGGTELNNPQLEQAKLWINKVKDLNERGQRKRDLHSFLYGSDAHTFKG